MSDFMADISNYTSNVKGATYKVNGQTIKVQNKGDNLDLDMTDFLQLMIAQLQNQGIDDSMDTSEMLNQMVQMQMITALSNMTDASVMSYGASLVGKEVTVAKVTANGLEELVGTVTGTGTMDGKQVIVIDNEYYYLNEILAVGKLPPKVEETQKPDEEQDTANKGETVEQPDDGADSGQDPVYSGQDGVPGVSED